jgi:polyisoprenoid-binding protein YceI
MAATKWNIDPVHSEIQFKVKHLMISTVTGLFKKFESVMETEDGNFATAKGHFSADINSITTFNDQRDGHLNGADFFDEVNHPKLTFVTEKIEKADGENYKVHGIFTLRGISKKIILDAEFGGVNQDQRGNTRMGLSLNGKINRKDFGVSFGLLTETTNAVVSNEVKLLANVQFVRL